VSTAPRSAQVRAILGPATQMPPSAREAFVREAVGDDEELFAELMMLLDGPASEVFERAARLLAENPSEQAEGSGHGRSAMAVRQVLPSGTRLGLYTIREPLGFGGMGEVYRAHDTQLQRDVAIKLLPAHVASRPDLIERFRREAKLLAALNHRNIAAIYGLHEADGVIALILELVEGPTLANRLKGGPLQLPELVEIAKQIAEALEAAHEKGIVHRDLKPDNVKVRPDGEVKVLDFGIAKALNAPHETVTDVEHLSLTVPGAVFGTPAYMSPEQLRGLPVDRRTDMWAFGLLLWEMLTAKRVFDGVTPEDRVAAVLNAEPAWDTLPRNTPLSVRRLLERTLQKDRKRRLDSASVARLELDDAFSTALAPAAVVGRQRLPWVVALASVVALAALTALILLRPQPASVATRASVELGADIALREDLGPATVLSPDGRAVVFASRATDVPSMLYFRKLDSLVATPLGSTENATSPFFSPDGKWIAFFADRKLKRISASGGAATVICDAPSGRGGWWGTDGTIVFAGESVARAVISRVSASGGTPAPVTTLTEGDVSHRWPQMLPGNRGVLYTSNTSDNWDDARLMVQPLPSGSPVVVQSGFFGRYVTSGHLLYVRRGTVYAVPFDLGRLQVTGPSIAVVDDVGADPTTGGAQLSVSEAGSLIYLQGHGFSPGAPAVWMDRGGNTMPLRTKRSEWGNPRFSPDGKQMAFDVSDGKQVDVWVQDLATEQLRRLTFDQADEIRPVWSPDGRWIAFASNREGTLNLYRIRSDGVGSPERLTQSPNAQSPASWHPGGRFLAFEESRPGSGLDVMTLAMPPAGAAPGTLGVPSVFAASPSVDAEPIFSPDGRWLAYRSSESGRIEIFVEGFDGVRGKWQVSNGGGRDAAWSTVRRELLYFGTTQERIMVAPYEVVGESFRVAAPRPWSIIRVGRPPRSGRMFDLHPDGERVVAAPAENQKSDHMIFVSDLADELRRLAPAAP